MHASTCSQQLRQQIAANLQIFKTRTLPSKDVTRAAVAITIVEARGEDRYLDLVAEGSGEAAIILTRRAAGLKKHAGQWALPGGRLDPNETVQEAGLRELEEEVGLSLTKKDILGELDPFVTRSGFHISPVILWGGKNVFFTRNESEVASIHRIPLRELYRNDSPTLEAGTDADRPVLYLPIGNTYIATPTAAILYQFREVALSGRDTRVSHYDQPYFAWR